MVPLIDTMVLVALAAAVLLAATRQLDGAIRLLAVQSIALVVVAGGVAFAEGGWHLWLATLAALVVKGLLVPRILFYILDHLKVRHEDQIVIQTKLLLVLAAGLISLAYWVTRPLSLTGPTGSSHALPAAIALILMGGLLMITRRKALSQIVGLMVMENGLYLAAMVVTAGMPLIIELGIFFDILLGVLVMGVITFRISRTFDSINVDRLRRLRH